MHNTSDLLPHLNAVQSLLMLLITPVLFLLWHVKVSAVEKPLEVNGIEVWSSVI